MIHVHTKQLAWFERVGERITGDRRRWWLRGDGYEKVHVAIVDTTRLAYVDFPDEQNATTFCFLAWSVAWFGYQRIIRRRFHWDSGSAYRSGSWRKGCKTLAFRVIRTKPQPLLTNGQPKRSSRHFASTVSMV